jgi:aminoglycoside/choline kinase family phosphotransferase
VTTTAREANDAATQARGLVQAFLEERRGRTSASAVAVAPLSGDASTRRYFRLAESAGTRVLALYPEPFVAAELPFLSVGELLAQWGLPVPAVLDENGGRGILVLEDLGDLTLQEVLRDASPARREELYREALEELARLQRESGRGAQRAPCFQIAFDIEKLSWELHYFLKHFVEGLRGCDLTAEDRATLAEGFHILAAEIASWPRVLCHRDFHSRNLMQHRGRLYWIDFQDARMGPVTYDLASLLRDAYVDVPEELIATLAEEFRQKVVPGESREVFGRRFELTCVQRNLKALGTFGYMTTARGSDVYMPYVPRTLAHVRRNLTRHPELGGLARTLTRLLPELA